MTTGEYLVAHSTLPTGTALAHLLALQVGTGAGRVVYCSQFTTVLTQDEVVVTSKQVQRMAGAAVGRSEQAPPIQTDGSRTFAPAPHPIDLVVTREANEVVSTAGATRKHVAGEEIAKRGVTRKPARSLIN